MVMNIKRSLFAGLLSSVMLVGNACAVEVCAKSGTYIGILKIDTNGESFEINPDNKQWKVNYDYKTITGLAACNEIGGAFANPTTDLITSYADSGTNCWCKMEPVFDYGYDTGIVSYWVFLRNDYDSPDACNNACTEHCASAMSFDSDFRRGIFNSLW